MSNKIKKNIPDTYDELSPEHQKRTQSLIFSYAAFLFAFFLSVSSFTEKSQINSVVIGLILISLPAVIFLALIDFVVRTRQKRKESAIRGFALLFTFFPSLAALGVYVWPHAPWASIIYFLSLALWLLLFRKVAKPVDDEEEKI